MTDRSQFQPGPATDHYHDTIGVGEAPIETPTLEQVLETSNETGEHTIDMPMGTIDGTTAQAGVEVSTSGSGAISGALVSLRAATTDGGLLLALSGDHDVDNGPYGAAVSLTGATSANGGDARLRGGSAANPTGAEVDARGTRGNVGGDLVVTPGEGSGGGRDGLVFLNLPTSNPGVAGALWADTLVVKVSAG